MPESTPSGPPTTGSPGPSSDTRCADGAIAAAAWRLSTRMACVAMAGLLLLAVATTADVVMRYAFAWPIRGFADVAPLAGAVLLAACFPYVLCARSNIAIDALGDWLGPRPRRVLDRFAAIVSASFFAVLAWQYVAFADGLRHDGQTMPILGGVVWPWWAAVAVFVLLAAVAGGLTAWHRPEQAP